MGAGKVEIALLVLVAAGLWSSGAARSSAPWVTSHGRTDAPMSALRALDAPLESGTMPVPPEPVTKPSWTAGGVVRGIDRATGMIRLRHGRLAALGVSAGTTSFRVAHRDFIDQVRVGQPVRFSATRVNGQLVMTHLGVVARRDAAGR